MATSEARTAANRLNARKSTGPRTAEGKDRSSRNATKHGMTAKTSRAIAGEDPGEMNEHLGRWADDLRPGNVAEGALVEVASLASWRLKRSALAEAAAVAKNVRHAAGGYDLAQTKRAYDLGFRLLSDPVCRTAAVKRDAEFTAKVHAWLELEPAVLVAELESFAAGVDWMLREWRGLADVLRREGYWHFPEKHAAIRLLGRRFENVLNDPVVTELFLACNVAHVGAWTFFNECIQATLYANTKPPFFKRVNELELGKPKDKESARAVLWKYVRREVRRLSALKRRLDVEAEVDRRQEEQKALFDAGPDAALRLRYETANQRTMLKAIAELARLRKSGVLDRASGGEESAKARPSGPRGGVGAGPDPGRGRGRADRGVEDPAPATRGRCGAAQAVGGKGDPAEGVAPAGRPAVLRNEPNAWPASGGPDDPKRAAARAPKAEPDGMR